MKKQKNKTAGLQKRQAIAGYLFISPFIVGFLVFMIKPFFQSLYMSFCDVQIGAGSFNPIWQGFTNYVKAFRVDPDFTRLLVEEIARMAVYSLAIMVFSFFVSLILNQKFKGRALVRAIFFLPVILSSGVIIGLETDNALMASLEASIEQTTSGISVTAAMENILRTAGIGTRAYEEVFELIDNIYDVAVASGIQIIIFLSGLQTIPQSMYEAADIEGCTKWESLWKITFPMVSPVIVVNVVYSLIDNFTMSTNETMTYIFDTAFSNFDYGLSSAMAWLYCLVLAIIVGIAMLVISKRVVYQS